MKDRYIMYQNNFDVQTVTKPNHKKEVVMKNTKNEQVDGNCGK